MDAVTAIALLILANTIFIVIALAVIFYVVTRVSMQMAQVSIVLAELTDLIKVQKTTLEKIEWRS